MRAALPSPRLTRSGLTVARSGLLLPERNGSATADQVMQCRQGQRLWAGGRACQPRRGLLWRAMAPVSRCESPGPQFALCPPRHAPGMPDPNRDARRSAGGHLGCGPSPAHGRTRMACRRAPPPRARLHQGHSGCRRAGCSRAGNWGCGLDPRGTSTRLPPREDKCAPVGVTQQPVNLRRKARHALNGWFPDQSPS